MRIEIMPLAVAQVAFGLLDIRRAGASQGIDSLLLGLLIDPYRDQHAGGALGDLGLLVGRAAGLLVHIGLLVGAADGADQRTGVGTYAGTNRYADRADDRRGHRASGGTDRSAYTTALGRAETGMAGTGRAFIITAD